MASPTVRENVATLSVQKLAELRKAIAGMQAISDNRGFNYWAGVHGVPQWKCWHHNVLGNSNQHLTYPLFLPWHRAYLYHFEQYLKDIVPTSALHWWNWETPPSSPSKLPTAYSAATGANGQPNPLLKSHINYPASHLQRDTKRDSGSSPGMSLPTPADVQNLWTLSSFIAFSGQLENLHDDVHGWTGGLHGDMGTIAVAAFDPIFWAHHAMIDRLWFIWQEKFGQGTGIPTHMLDSVLDPFNMKVSDVLHVEALGYTYADSSSQVLI